MKYLSPHHIDMGAMAMVLDMQSIGLPADPDHFRQLERDFGIEVAQLEERIQEINGGYINVGSHQQVSRMLYDKLKLPKPKIKSKKSGSTMTGNEILGQLAGMHPVIALLKEHRMYAKLLNTYVVPMYTRFIQPNGRVYPKYNITKVETGRLSAEGPNIMAVPARTKQGKMIRKGYKPIPGCVFLSIDFSGVEMRVLAWQANDERMIGVFRSGEDLHYQTAGWMYGKPVDQIDESTERKSAKTIGFGVVYGVSAEGLYRNIITFEGCEDWTVERCQNAIDKWFGVYPGVKAYMASVASEAIRNGYVEDFVGRRRLVPGAQLKSEQLKSRAIRQAGNHPIQGGAQELIKMSMGKINPLCQDMRKKGYYVWPLCQIHDEILFEVQTDIVHWFAVEAQGIMENIVETSTGLKTDAEWSDQSWGHLVSIW